MSAGLLLSLAACGPSDPPVAPPETESETAAELDTALHDDIENGRAIVVENCTSCHAVGPDGESPRTDAPPLRYALSGLSAEALSDNFREGIHVGAVDMPDFDFGPRGTASVVAYIQSIQEAPPAETE
ncbi:MAG: hypothetical protein CMK07_05130 [Ponticaulis sp.]|nr:hypothetical protein [Ponticaulis sp.]